MKIGKHTKLIKSFLEKGGLNKSFRDNDNKLIAVVWNKLLKEMDIDSKEISGWTLLTHLSKGDLPTPESITRCRRKLQEEIPELRGLTWTKRHKKQTEVKKELSNLVV